MREIAFTIAGLTLRGPRLCAFDQLAVLEAATPFLVGLKTGVRGGSDAAQAAMRAFADIPEREVELVLDLALKGLEVYDQEEWRPFWSQVTHEACIKDCDLSTIVSIAYCAVQEHLQGFWDYEATKFDARGESGPSFEPVRMSKGRSFLMRPVHQGFYRMESLFDGTLDLWHVSMAHDSMAVEAENESRAHKAAQTNKGRG